VIFRRGHPPQCQPLAKDAGIPPSNRGIVVDDSLQTGAPDIFAIGRMSPSNSRHLFTGLVEPAYEQGGAFFLARAVWGGWAPPSLRRPAIVATNLKVSGRPACFPAGDFQPGSDGSRNHRAQ